MIDIQITATVICDVCGKRKSVPNDIPWVDCEATAVEVAVVYAAQDAGWHFQDETGGLTCPDCPA
jgi:hypothetical protein